MCFIRSSFINGVNIVLIVSMSSESQSMIVHWKCYDLSKFDFENKMDGKRCQWSTLGSSLGSMSLCFAICTSSLILIIGIKAHLCPSRSALGSPPSSVSQRIWLHASRPTNQHSPETNNRLAWQCLSNRGHDNVHDDMNMYVIMHDQCLFIAMINSFHT